MPISFQTLTRAIKSLEGKVDFLQPLSPDDELIDRALAANDRELAKSIFRRIAGRDCPALLEPLLTMPDETAVAWQTESARGEFRIYGPARAITTRIDPSYGVREGIDIGAMAVLDQITDTVGPHFVLFDPSSIDTRGLILFDGTKIANLSITPEEYVVLAGTGAGFDSWQFLFASLPITADREKSMRDSFSLVKDANPVIDMTKFAERLSAI